MKYIFSPFLLWGFFLASFWLLKSCVPITSSQSSSGNNNGPIEYKDKNYNINVKTVQLYPAGLPQAPAVKSVKNSTPFILKFDLLNADYQDLRAKIIHCNADWQPSRYSGMDYLTQYNEFNINNQQLSINTHVEFSHYTFELPEITKTGNYIIAVYRGSNSDDLILTRRFLIYQKQVPLKVNLRQSTQVSQLRTHHQINFSLNYGKVGIENPYRNVNVVIRQNERWMDAIKNLEPSFVRENENTMEYELFNSANAFPAGNEHRFFDLRYVRSSGRNVERINEQTAPNEAYLVPDADRGSEAYSSYQDLNGYFIIQNRETGGSHLDSDYLKTHFSLKRETPVDGEVYLLSQFTNGKLKEKFKLNYNAEKNQYQTSVLLKQGYYFYQYYVKSGNRNPFILEGNHYDTENRYDILVYVRPPGARADKLLGYSSFNSGNQQ